MGAYVLAVFLAVAGVTHWGARKYGDWSDSKRRRVVGLMLVGGVVAAGYSYLTDTELRRATLFEVAGPWGDIGNHRFAFAVEHPQVEHRLRVNSEISGPLSPARDPIVLRVRLRDEGGHVFIDATETFHLQRRSGGGRGGPGRVTWEMRSHAFTPRHDGAHRLEVRAVSSPPA